MGLARQIDRIDALGLKGGVLHRGRERHRGARAHNAKKLRPLIEVVDVVNGAHDLRRKLAGRHAQVFPRRGVGERTAPLESQQPRRESHGAEAQRHQPWFAGAVLLEQAQNLKVVAQSGRLRGDLDHLDRQSGQPGVHLAERHGVVIIVIGDNHLGGLKLAKPGGPGASHRFDLHVHRLAAGADRGAKHLRLLLNGAAKKAARSGPATGGDGLWEMQAQKHLVQARLQVDVVLKVVQAKLVSNGRTAHAPRLGFHGAQARPCQGDKDAR